MSKVLRALIIAATATGVAAAVYVLRQPADPDRQIEPPSPSDSPAIIDADALSDDARNELTDELGAML